ncbi:putative disease resistance protein RGA3 [Papaver somniferum]|uniref:putative disease resistance protein RGA3 n=1 Tax=Papaver somniferum TaxID=3469 RepID=UPI000E6F4A83|nr:putative disease resistance protein RGA3 [Papaver somniferum]
MGGLGKTSIAQLIYKDDSIVRNFDLRAWVCVSDTFDIYKILRDIIESITGYKCENPSNVDVLAKQVKEKLFGRKYLLVLDDLWNEDVRDWEKLKSFLVYGGNGSKILVTTRNQKVASVVGGTVHDLKKLSDVVCWSIIEQKVLSRGEAVLTKEMTNIGTKIARKCDGLPLAANSLGGLICSRRDKSYWLSIVNSINRLQEGFLLSSSGGDDASLGDIGDVQMDEESGDIESCKMHDLASSVLDCNEFGITSVRNRKKEVAQVRRLQLLFDKERGLASPKVLPNAKKLPTIIALNPWEFSHVNSFFRYKRLRILFPLRNWSTCSLSDGLESCLIGHEPCFTSLISKLKHLRYLDLAYVNLSGKVSLNHSYNLQTLVLRKFIW